MQRKNFSLRSPPLPPVPSHQNHLKRHHMSATTSFNHLSAELPENGNHMMWKAAGVLVPALAVFGLTRNQDAAADVQGSSESKTSAVSGQSFTPDDRFTGYLEVINSVAKNSSTVCQNSSKKHRQRHRANAAPCRHQPICQFACASRKP